MRRPHGYAVWHTAEGIREADTIQCCHCNRHQIIQPRQDPSTLGGYCTMCDGHICQACDNGRCLPFEKRLELIERRAQLYSNL